MPDELRASSTPDPGDWPRILQMFNDLVDLPLDQALHALRDMAGREPSIHDEVRDMLRANAAGESVVQDRLAAGASHLLGDDPNANVGHFIGPYRCLEMLPRGGMGIVYRAQREDYTRIAAVKTLPMGWIDPNRLDDFNEEIRTLATLSHPGVAQLYEGGTTDEGIPWFAMEYVDGVRITEWLWTRSASVRQVLELFRELCDAMQYVHEQIVIHRDLKPSNVLVTPEGRVKVIDFGIAKRYAELPRGDLSTERMIPVLTKAYAAPEQFEGMRATANTDVYALGILLHELLTRQRPYEVRDVATGELLPAILDAWPPDIKRPSPVHPLVSALGALETREINIILECATNPDRAERYGSAAEFRGDIDAFLQGRALSRPGVPWTYRPRKYLRRHAQAIVAGTALAAAAATALVSYNRSLAAERDIALGEVARTARIRTFLEEMFQTPPLPSLPAESTRVATIVERGLKEAGALNDDPTLQIDLLWSLGLINERIANLGRADSVYKLAVAGATAAYGPHAPETLRLRVRPARLMFLRNQPDSARLVVEELERLAQRYLPTDHPVQAELSLLHGNLLYAIGQGAAAVTHLQRAIELQAARDSSSREYAQAWRELGNAYVTASDLARGDSAWRRARIIMTRRLGARHYEVGILLANLGNVASRRGALAQAARDQEEAVSILREWYGANHYLTASAQQGLGQTLIRQGRHKDALQHVKPALDAMARFPETGPATANYGIVRGTYAIALSGSGEWRQAMVEFAGAIALLHKTLGRGHPNTLRLEASRALSFTGHGYPDSAQTLFRELVSRAGTMIGPTDLSVFEFRVGLAEALVHGGQQRAGIELLAGTLPVIDSALSKQSDTGQRGRRALARAFAELGDSVEARRWRGEVGER